MLLLVDGFHAVARGTGRTIQRHDVVDSECHISPYTSDLRMRAEMMSMTLTLTTMMIITAHVSAYWKPRMISHSTTPMPPAPTMPTTDAERTFDSKRYSEYEIQSGSTWGMTP